MRISAATSLLMAGFFLSGHAVAQDVSADPLYETLRLSEGFLPDPSVVSLTAGGGDDASHLGGGCTGDINNAQPDVDLVYESSGSKRLGIYVKGGIDTTLVINAPDGRWYCNDDFGSSSGTNPGVVFNKPQNGYYNIWVGTYGGGVGSGQVDLLVSEYPPEKVW